MADNVKVIDDEGDVILVIGRADRVRLKVSAATLSKASPVFKALLGPNFSQYRIMIQCDSTADILEAKVKRSAPPPTQQRSPYMMTTKRR